MKKLAIIILAALCQTSLSNALISNSDSRTVFTYAVAGEQVYWDEQAWNNSAIGRTTFTFIETADGPHPNSSITFEALGFNQTGGKSNIFFQEIDVTSFKKTGDSDYRFIGVIGEDYMVKGSFEQNDGNAVFEIILYDPLDVERIYYKIIPLQSDWAKKMKALHPNIDFGIDG